MVTGLDVVHETLRVFAIPGIHYGSFDCPHRCRPDQWPHCVDCSGLTSYVLNRLGLHEGCTGSFEQARKIHAAHRGMPIDVAMRTPGAFLFQGVNEGQGGRPGIDPGHVGISAGFGDRTFEARGHYSGVGVFYGRSQVWDWAGMPVGVALPKPAPAPTPASVPLPVMLPLVSKEERTRMFALPKSASTPKGEVATARAVPELNIVLLESGGRLVGDQPVAGDMSGTKRFWVPPKSAQVPGWDLLALADLRPGENALLARFGFPNGDTGTYKAPISV